MKNLNDTIVCISKIPRLASIYPTYFPAFFLLSFPLSFLLSFLPSIYLFQLFIQCPPYANLYSGNKNRRFSKRDHSPVFMEIRILLFYQLSISTKLIYPSHPVYTIWNPTLGLDDSQPRIISLSLLPIFTLFCYIPLSSLFYKHLSQELYLNYFPDA